MAQIYRQSIQYFMCEYAGIYILCFTLPRKKCNRVNERKVVGVDMNKVVVLPFCELPFVLFLCEHNTRLIFQVDFAIFG